MDASPQEARLIRLIAARAVETADPDLKRSQLLVEMDLTATHLNGCPLRLRELLGAGDTNFWHDINGIERHLDRTTGQLGGFFSPRCSR
ncbi:MAG: hypothetical protein DI590_05960 [Methylorubrum populi]|nr:MAG: hypothetical protein DI590_05960 [Methylorubrum populi]